MGVDAPKRGCMSPALERAVSSPDETGMGTQGDKEVMARAVGSEAPRWRDE